MSIKKITLLQVDPVLKHKDTSVPFSVYNLAEPLGLLCLASFLENAGYEVQVIHPKVNYPIILSERNIIKRIIDFCPRIISFSCMTRQVLTAHKLAVELKSRIPEVITVVGGDHFSAIPNDIGNFSAFDIAVSGEGEECFRWIIEHFSEDWSDDDTPVGIYWKVGKQIIGHGTASRISHIDDLPTAKRIYPLLLSSHVGALMYPPLSEQHGMISVFSSRGCPFNCSYCDAAQVWSKRVIWRNPELVVQELKEAMSRYAFDTAFFVDLTFNASKDKMMALCSTLAREKLKIAWYVLLRPGVPNSSLHIDREMLEALKKAGCTKVGFGVETISFEVSQELNRLKGNGHLIEMCRYMDELGLLSKAFFIIGHPVETNEYYLELAEYLKQLCADEIRVSFLTPFPGTPLWHKYKDMLPRQENYDKYTTFQPLIPHPVFSSEQLKRLRFDLISKYYSSTDYHKHIKSKINRHPHLKSSFWDFIDYINRETSRASIMVDLDIITAARTF